MQEAFSVAFHLWGWSPGNPENPKNILQLTPILVVVSLTTPYGWYNRALVRLQLNCPGLAAQSTVSSADILAALNSSLIGFVLNTELAPFIEK